MSEGLKDGDAWGANRDAASGFDKAVVRLYQLVASPPTVALPAATSTLLTIPLKALPTMGKLAITVTPFGRRFGAPQEETGTTNLG